MCSSTTCSKKCGMGSKLVTVISFILGINLFYKPAVPYGPPAFDVPIEEALWHQRGYSPQGPFYGLTPGPDTTDGWHLCQEYIQKLQLGLEQIWVRTWVIVLEKRAIGKNKK